MALFGWLAASQPTVLFSHIISAPTASQPAVFFSHNKSAPATSQPNEAYMCVHQCLHSLHVPHFHILCCCCNQRKCPSTFNPVGW
jgi:hypothetical protein